jgi:hypothetical protein
MRKCHDIQVTVVENPRQGGVDTDGWVRATHILLRAAQRASERNCDKETTDGYQDYEEVTKPN